MSKYPYAVMQPERLVADITAEIMNGPRKTQEDIYRVRQYLEQAKGEPRDNLSKKLLGSCVDEAGLAGRLHDLALMRHRVAVTELLRVGILTGDHFNGFSAFILCGGLNTPPEEIMHQLDSDERSISTRINAAADDIKIAVRTLLASRLETEDGASLTWLDAKNELQARLDAIQSLLTDIRSVHDEYKQWIYCYRASNEEEPCDVDRRHDCCWEDRDCEECTPPYAMACRLLCDYDNLLADHLNDAMRIMWLLVRSDLAAQPMPTDEITDFYNSLAYDAEYYRDTPEMSAANLRECYKAAIIEDNRVPIDGQTAREYWEVCFVADCWPPDGSGYYLSSALRMMNASLAYPAVQVKALIMAVEQAKAASAAREALNSYIVLDTGA